MIDSSLSYCLMILVIISSLSVISIVQLPQKVMAHILGEEETKVHSGMPNQLMLVLALTVIITVVIAQVQQAGVKIFRVPMEDLEKIKVWVKKRGSSHSR